MLLAASAMAALLAGCGGTAQGDGSHQASSSSHQASSSSQKGSSQQTTEPATNETSVGSCADKGSTVGQLQEAGRGDVSNGKIVFTRSNDVTSDIYVVDEEGAHETQLTCTKQSEEAPVWLPDGQSEEYPVWSPDGQKIAYLTTGPSGLGMLHVMNADGTNRIRLPEGNLAGAVSWGGGLRPGRLMDRR